MRRHALHHGRRHHASDGQAHEHVGADHGVGQGATTVVGTGEGGLFLAEVGATGVDDTFGIDQRDVALGDTEGYEEFDAGDRGRASAGDHDLDVGEFLVGELGRVH